MRNFTYKNVNVKNKSYSPSLLFNIGFYLFLHTNNNKRFKNIDIMIKLIKEGEKIDEQEICLYVCRRQCKHA